MGELSIQDTDSENCKGIQVMASIDIIDNDILQRRKESGVYLLDEASVFGISGTAIQ